jgi:hypothetical protein
MSTLSYELISIFSLTVLITVRGLTGYEAWMLFVRHYNGLLSPLISIRLVRRTERRRA